MKDLTNEELPMLLEQPFCIAFTSGAYTAKLSTRAKRIHYLFTIEANNAEKHCKHKIQ